MKTRYTNYYGALLGTLVILFGVLILCVPFLSDHILVKQQEQAITDVLNTDGISSNKNSIDVGEATLGAPEGILEIPSIALTVPIYEGTEETVLQKGIGHLEGSSDILGGTGKHSVLSGHRGLSIAKLFTDLPDVKKGDSFFIIDQEGNEYREYKVDKIQEVEANELEKNTGKYFEMAEDKDYVTLLTCTPLYINSNRWLVRGERVDFNKSDMAKTGTLTSTFSNKIKLGLMIFFSILLVILVYSFISKRKKGTRTLEKVVKTKKISLVFLGIAYFLLIGGCIAIVLGLFESFNKLSDPLNNVFEKSADPFVWSGSVVITIVIMLLFRVLTDKKAKKINRKGLRSV